MNNIKINLINLESTDCVIFDNIKFNNCSYLQLLIDDIDIRLFDEFDDFLIVYSELYASAQNSGKFLIFTCACGVAEDGIMSMLLIKRALLNGVFFEKRAIFLSFQKRII